MTCDAVCIHTVCHNIIGISFECIYGTIYAMNMIGFNRTPHVDPTSKKYQ